MSGKRRCALCAANLPPHGFYIVRIDIFAEPSVPPITSENLHEMDLDGMINQLLAEMENLSTEELQNQVHRRFQYVICGNCQKKLLSNPLGKPRRSGTSRN